MRELILGGARSGKSRLAEKRAIVCEALGMEVVYIATAEAWDAEMNERLAHHRARRNVFSGLWSEDVFFGILWITLPVENRDLSTKNVLPIVGKQVIHKGWKSLVGR